MRLRGIRLELRRRFTRLHDGRRQDEQGAVAVMVAGLIVVVVAMAAFAVDLGMQRVVRSDMQALADVVALDSARLLDGRNAGQVRNGTTGKLSLDAASTASMNRNKASVVGTVTSVTATLVYITAGPNGERLPLRNTDGSLTAVPDSAKPDAVWVTALGNVPFAFAPGSGSASRSALGTASSYGCFRLGSFAASLTTNNTAVSGVFESLVGDALGMNLRAVGYQGLISSSIGIPALAAQLGVATPQELVNLNNVKVADLLRAGARVLTSQGDTSGSLLLADIAGRVSQSLVLNIGNVLAVGGGSALVGNINALDLVGSAGVAASTVLANGNNFLDTGVAWSAPHVSSGVISLQAVSAPAQYCGPVGGSTRTAQVSLVSDFDFQLPNKILSSLAISNQADLSVNKATMHIDASLAGATGTLASVTCGAGTAASPQITAVNVDTNLLTTNVRLPFRLSGTLDATTSNVVPNSLLTSLFGILGVGATVEVTMDLNGASTAGISTSPRTATEPTIFSVPPLTYGQAQPSVGSGQSVSLPTPTVVLDTSVPVMIRVTTLAGGTRTQTVSASSLDLTSVVSAIASSVIGTSTSTVVSNVNQALVPVSQLLGIRVAGADVIGTFAPSCSSPSLGG